MASLKPGGKPTDKIPTPKIPREILDKRNPKKKSSGKSYPPASAKRDAYSKQAERMNKQPARKFAGGSKPAPSVPRQKPVTNPARKTRTRRMIP